MFLSQKHVYTYTVAKFFSEIRQQKALVFLYRTVSVYVAHAYTRVKTNQNTSASNGERGLDTKARTLLNFQKFHIVVCSKSVSLLLFF